MTFNIIQLILATALIVVIILQNRGSGLGAAFGGDSNVYRTKRGMEKFLFRATVVIAIIFFVTAFINVLY
ncbi:MAG: preprotein translocase subunit SecG [Patescibacteria group bacterium]